MSNTGDLPGNPDRGDRQIVYGVSVDDATGILFRATRFGGIGGEIYEYEPLLEFGPGGDRTRAMATPCSPTRIESLRASLGTGWQPEIETWFLDFQAAYEHGMSCVASPPANPYTGRYCVDICQFKGETRAFVIVRFGAELPELRYEYEPLLALDPQNGNVLMQFDWEDAQENGDDTWADVSSPRAPLGLFDDFETAYFYSQGLVRRAA